MVVKEPFRVNLGLLPWHGGAVQWHPLGETVCMKIEAVIGKMASANYDGQTTVLIPMPLVDDNLGNVQRTYFVAINKEYGTGALLLNQMRIQFQFDAAGCVTKDLLARQIMTPDYTKALYPLIQFSDEHINKDELHDSFFYALVDHWAEVCQKIRTDSPHMKRVVRTLGNFDINTSILMQYVLQANIMQPNATPPSLMFPVGNEDNTFLAFIRAGNTTVNTVSIRFLRETNPMSQRCLHINGRLEQVFDGWTFDSVGLTLQDLHELVQVPVRTHYFAVTNAISLEFLRPRLYMFFRAFHTRVEGRGVGIIGKDLKKNIITIFLKQWMDRE